MHKLKEIEILEEEIQSRILDHRYADSWEQADIKKKEAELARLKKKVSK